MKEEGREMGREVRERRRRGEEDGTAPSHKKVEGSSHTHTLRAP